MGWWHDKNDNSMNVGDSRSVVAARPHLREVVQQRRGNCSVVGGDGVWGRLGCTASGCARRRGTVRPTAAPAKLLAARLRRVWRASGHRHRGNSWHDEAAVCAGGATTAGAARSPVCVCGPVRGGGGRHSCAATTTQSARRRPSAKASTGRQGTDGGGGELGFRHPGATMVLGHLGRKPRR